MAKVDAINNCSNAKKEIQFPHTNLIFECWVVRRLSFSSLAGWFVWAMFFLPVAWTKRRSTAG
jgi:hypothetical protein